MHQISKWFGLDGGLFKTAENSSSDNWEDVFTAPCFRGRSFKCNSRQCLDIAHYLEDTAPFRKQAWERIRVLKCEQDIYIMEFCRAIVEANLFLQDCSLADSDFWKNAYTSLTKLDTGEAYDVLLHNLIWFKAGLDLAIVYAGSADDMHPNVDYSKEIKKRVEECQRELSRYRSDFTQPRLNIDRDEFYRSVENPQIRHYADESQKKWLDFLVRKSKANYQLLQSVNEATASGDGGIAQQLMNEFEIDARDIDRSKEERLGRGGYGVVYRMLWLGQTVAVKVFGGTTLELFKKEASLLAGIQNPFIVHMVGWCSSTEKVGEEDGECMLVMELAQTDLKTVINKKAFIISRPAAVDIMLQISKAMEYLHKRKIIHRDLKPNNVLLEPSSVKQLAAVGYARVKLCDFGLAKVKAQSEEHRSQYTTLNVGTSYYRAPEIIEDEADGGKYSRKADVFSFAITCYEILAGSTGTPDCYKGLNTKDRRNKMLANVRPKLPEDCPAHVVRLIESCWDTEPNRRPPFSRISKTLSYIKFIFMRVPDVQRVPYDSVVNHFDEDELSEEEIINVEKLDKDSVENLNLKKEYEDSLGIPPGYVYLGNK